MTTAIALPECTEPETGKHYLMKKDDEPVIYVFISQDGNSQYVMTAKGWWFMSEVEERNGRFYGPVSIGEQQ